MPDIDATRHEDAFARIADVREARRIAAELDELPEMRSAVARLRREAEEAPVWGFSYDLFDA